MEILRTRRLNLLGALVCAFALVIAGRLYYLQIVKGDEYAAQAEKQYVNRAHQAFDRGSIFFSPRKGNPISAATLASGYSVSINPKQIKYPEDVFNALSGILPVDEEELLSVLEAPNPTYKEVAKRVDEGTKKRLDKLAVTGIDTTLERWRSYPGGSLAANVLGIVGYGENGTTLEGRYGLEKYYEDVLRRNSSGSQVNFFAEIFSNLGGGVFGAEDAEGSIVTTIEPSVQAELEKKLSGIVSEWKSDLTGGIVMDPKTGEIYAMAMNPSFDPNVFAKEKNLSVLGNPMVDRVYEMGSIIKPLAMAAALDAGAVTAKTTYDDKGTIVVNGSRISNYDGRARGIADMQKVLNESLNVGMAFVSQKLGNKKLTEYYRALGFGEETGIDLPGEVHGLISNLGSPRDIEHVTAAYGQGIALTPIATVRALSALGNGGYLPEPHVVKSIEYASGDTKTLAYAGGKDQVFRPETSEEITRMLVKVVDEALLGGTVKMDRYSIAAKTGTAQMAMETGRGYYGDRYLHSFFGYFPAYDPKFIVFLYTVYPKGATYASHTLTRPFIDLAKFLINYYEVPPDR